MAYFLVTSSNGEIRIHEGSSEEILSYLETDEDSGEFVDSAFGSGEQFPADPMYWGDNRVMIIKGEVVTPRPVSVKYELP